MFFDKNISDDAVLKFIKPKANTMLSKMNGYDLQDFLILLDDFYLTLRDKLNFDESTTFGTEIEIERTDYVKVKKTIQNLQICKDWNVKPDGSLTKGAEINSPILYDKTQSWEELNIVCAALKGISKIGSAAGGHIHVGVQALGNNKESWKNFIKMWAIYENVIYRFCYGEFLTGRSSLSEYASPVSNSFFECIVECENNTTTFEEMLQTVKSERYVGVNLQNAIYNSGFIKKNTIEFRCPNGSLEPVIWQNNINFFVKFLKYCRKLSNFNNDIIEARQQTNLNKYNSLDWYDEIYLEQALELSDLLFNNNLDKIYFLRQYLKSFEIIQDKSKMAKTFIKSKKNITK